jgi:hypothetical protein
MCMCVFVGVLCVVGAQWFPIRLLEPAFGAMEPNFSRTAPEKQLNVLKRNHCGGQESVQGSPIADNSQKDD